MSNKEIADEKVEKGIQEDRIYERKGIKTRIFVVAPNVLLRISVMFLFRSLKVNIKFLSSKRNRFLASLSFFSQR